MEWKELKNKKSEDLKKMLVASQEKLRELKFKDAGKQLKNVREIRETRKAIARIFTKLRQDNKQ